MQHATRTGPWGRVETWLASPKSLLMAAIAVVVVAGVGLRGVSKDPSVDAFVPGDHPAALTRDLAREVFGLEDPVIVGLLAPAGETVFTPERLEALRRIDAGVRAIEGVRKNDVVSLASENAILGDEGDLLVEPILAEGPMTAASAVTAWQRFRAMPMMSGLLAAEDGSLALVIVPVDDPNHAKTTVDAIRALAETEAGTALSVHVAGVAAMNARLADMVDTDTRIFVPAAIVTVLVILFVALRRAQALAGPLFVIAGSAAVAIGIMGWTGARYYLITTALPVVIMAIAVADSLHICTYYLRARAQDGSLSARDAAIDALQRAWLPVTLTSITTIAAFIGLSFGAAMRPISEFGVFAAIGVAAAWLLSLTALPAVLVLTDLEPATAKASIARAGLVDRAVSAITGAAFRRPALALGTVVVFVAALVTLAAQARFEYERQRYFTAGDTVRIADETINARLGGVNFLDVVVTAPEPGGLMTPAAMRGIASLRAEIAALPGVVKVNGIDEYLSLMHGVLTGAEAGTLPTRERAPSQYMFLYEASGAPEDFKQEIDYDHRRALIRAQLSTDRFSATQPTVEALRQITARWSAETGLAAALSGRVAVNEGWMRQLATNHGIGLAMALALVFATTLAVFRSPYFAVLAMVPVCVGVVSVYAAMGAFGIDIAPATSMTAAIATGLGVDFGIHLISTMRKQRAGAESLQAAFAGVYPVVARACFYSAVALGVALAVICISSAPPLRWFGFLVSVGAFGSLVGALIIVPAICAIGGEALERRTRYAVST